MVVIVEEVIVIAIEDTVVILIVNLSFHGVPTLGQVIVNTAESTGALVRLGIISHLISFTEQLHTDILYFIVNKSRRIVKKRKNILTVLISLVIYVCYIVY